MELLREPLDIDFIVDNRPLTVEEEISISEFIKNDKSKREVLKKKAISSTKKVIAPKRSSSRKSKTLQE